ncbi:MAG: hypothetical protein ABUT20_09290 [Bacteroidota bacterium]
MKIIHLNRNSSSLKTAEDYLQAGKQLEKRGDILGAIAMYEMMIKKNYRKDFGYQRIMILLRSIKEYKKELNVIDQAIEDFKKLYDRRNKLSDKKAITTSRKLIKLLGLDRDLSTYPQPIPRWINRKERLKKILSRMK